MSFTSDVKKELTTIDPGKKCCQLAQISGFLRFAGSITLMGGMGIKIVTDNPAVARSYTSLIKEYFGSKISLTVEDSSPLSGGRTYGLSITPDMNADAILRETGMLSVKEGFNYITDGIDSQIIRKKCCKKAALRGIFMASGSISGTKSKGYHMQISCNSQYLAEDVRKLISSFGLNAKLVEHSNKFLVYMKEGDQIADFMNLVGATNQMLIYQDAILMRSLKNKANRINNCEDANMNKTVAAAQKLISDIKLIDKIRGLDNIQPKLKEAAMMRLEYPELSLSDLAELFQPPLKKSGLNHRFAKITEIAEEIRKTKSLME